jgi:carbonic anhydrase
MSKLLILMFIISYLNSQIINYDEKKWPALCLKGIEQSPLNLPDPSKLPRPGSKFQFVTFAYELLGGIKLELRNDQDYRLNIGPYSTQNYVIILKDGAVYKYNLVDMVIKYRGEHKFNDKETDLEIQIVHEKDSNYSFGDIFDSDPFPFTTKLVIAIPLRLNTSVSGSFLEDLNANTRDFVKNLDLNKFINANVGYYYYAGSATTPPCEENTDWIVMQDIQAINSIQLNSIKDWMSNLYPNGNARVARSAINRSVYYYPKAGERTQKGIYLKFTFLAFIILIIF